MPDKCTPVVSSWLTHIGLWQGSLFCVFKKKGVCCWYPNTDESYYDIALSYASKGHFVHQWLYKILPYRIIANPCPLILGVTVGCCPGALSPTLRITVINTTGACTGLLGVTCLIVWDSAAQLWKGVAATTFGDLEFDFFCSNPVVGCQGFFANTRVGGVLGNPGQGQAGCACAPPNITLTNLNDIGYCAGGGDSIDVLVTLP